MKIWKRNAIIASVLLLVCAGVYLNWSKAQKTDVQDLTETLSAEQVMGEGTLVERVIIELRQRRKRQQQHHKPAQNSRRFFGRSLRNERQQPRA